MNTHMTGNRVLLKLMGKTIGYGVQSVDFQDSFGRQRVDGLGDGRAQELPPGQMSYTVTVSRYFIPQQSLTDLGIAPATVEAALTDTGIEIEVQDKVTQATMEHYTGCVLDSHSRNYAKFAISGSNATFQCLRKLK